MPNVLRIGRFRFFFFSNEGQEPAHIHVKAGEDEAKFWLEPQLELAENYGLRARDVKAALLLIQEHENEIREAWNTHFGGRSH